jgi:hypothetical protein
MAWVGSLAMALDSMTVMLHFFVKSVEDLAESSGMTFNYNAELSVVVQPVMFSYVDEVS